MTRLRDHAVLAAILATLSAAGCGGAGGSPTRPAEQLFFVRGPTGTPFHVAALIANNAVHTALPATCNDVPTGQTFQTPYTFVMLNADPVVSGVFRNDDPEQDITVTLVSALSVTNVQVIPPGFCCVVTPGGTCVDTPSACDDPPAPFGLETRLDVIAQLTQPPNPPNLFFTTSIGDLVNGTDTTNCVFTGSTAFCQTPTTFFLEGAEQQVAGIFNRADNAPLNLTVNLCIDGQLQRSNSGRNVIVSVNL